MLGLGLDNHGRTTKNVYRRIYSQPWINSDILSTMDQGNELEKLISYIVNPSQILLPFL
jgi:hypothetical protein